MVEHREHVGTIHVLRHKEARMTLRYLKTLSAQQCLEIQQVV
jgi:hypothetical protein